MKASILAAAAIFARVYGHGGIFNYTIDGVDYAGHYPWLPEEGQNSIQRRWWPDPIYRMDHPYLACNRGNPLATSLPKLHAPVRAGANITAWWKAPPCPTNPPVPFPTKPSLDGWNEYDPPFGCFGPENPWNHNQGPVIVYMADCGGPCDQWDGTGKRWFKIWETGYYMKGWSKDAGAGNDDWPINAGSIVWGQHAMANAGLTVTIPKELKPGYYMIRHEIINIDYSLQFFPECAQLEISGDGGKVPGEEYLAQFPGEYTMEDPGIYIGGKIWQEPAYHMFNYTMPGPKVWVP
ncbi:lytic polysaccharide monooxygenase [Hypomontagnella submonticulosa]|nr:lytic polysaccharide monooxygenase [Hypomontagnella submonticulosa]